MTPKEASEFLYAAVVAACDADTITVPKDNVAWPNVSFRIPKNVVWARITLRHDQDNPKSQSLGDASGKRYTYGAALIIQVFQPASTPATDLAFEHAWEFVSVLQSKRFGTGKELLTFGAAVREAENLEAEWFQVNVTIPFQYEHIA